MVGLFQGVKDDTNQNPADPEASPRFHEATALTHQPLEGLQHIELAMRTSGGQAYEATQESSPDHLDQTPEFHHAAPEPVPHHASPGACGFDQNWEA